MLIKSYQNICIDFALRQTKSTINGIKNQCLLVLTSIPISSVLSKDSFFDLTLAFKSNCNMNCSKFILIFTKLLVCCFPLLIHGAPKRSDDITLTSSSLLKQQLTTMIVAVDGILAEYVS